MRTNEPAGLVEPAHPVDRPEPPAEPLAVVEARRQLRAPAAASVAGILFAVMFTLALALLRAQPMVTANDAELRRIFEAGQDWSAVIGGLYLAPFSGIMFLWFLAVVRDQIGEREDRFFATVFIGSGLLFTALLFISAGVASSLFVGVRYLGQGPPSAETVAATRSLGYTLLFAFATRAAGVFLFAIATIALRSGAFPRWIAWTGYLLGLVLLVAVTFWDWLILVLPAWVFVLSLLILRRERARRGSTAGDEDVF
jgi:hypothetical protein